MDFIYGGLQINFTVSVLKQKLLLRVVDRVEAKILTLNDVSLGLSWTSNANHVDFQKVKKLFGGMETK